MAEVGDATSIDRSTAMASADTNKRRASEAARALTGMAVVELAFHFLDGPADVLRAATACRRWHELATADSVWRVKARREGMVEKAGVFEVALPVVADGAAAAVEEEEEDEELAGVGLAFYAQVFVLKVRDAWRGLRGRAFASPWHHRLSPPRTTACSAGLQDEG